jgi:hypothetical protein
VSHPRYNEISSRERGSVAPSSFCGATTRTRSLRWRIWPNISGPHPPRGASSTRVAGWCTHPAALGPAHLPGLDKKEQ